MAKRGYHHGNLRQALVEATVRLIEDRGPMGFTLAEAARQAGVSAAAPYRHFTGREQLIEEVARQGFLEFADRLAAALDTAPFRAHAVLCKPEISYTAANTPPAIQAEVDKYYLANAPASSLLDALRPHTPQRPPKRHQPSRPHPAAVRPGSSRTPRP